MIVQRNLINIKMCVVTCKIGAKSAKNYFNGLLLLEYLLQIQG